MTFLSDDMASRPPLRGHISPAQSTLWLLAAKTTVFALGLAVPLLLVRRLPVREFGVYKQLFLLVDTAVVILPLGFALSAFFFFPREPERKAQVVRNILLVHMFMGAIGGVLVSVFPALPAALLSSPDLAAYAPEIGLVMLLLVGSSFVEFVAIANGEAHLAALFIGVSQVLRSGLFITAASLFGSVRALAYAAVGATLLCVAPVRCGRVRRVRGGLFSGSDHGRPGGVGRVCGNSPGERTAEAKRDTGDRPPGGTIGAHPGRSRIPPLRPAAGDRSRVHHRSVYGAIPGQLADLRRLPDAGPADHRVPGLRCGLPRMPGTPPVPCPGADRIGDRAAGRSVDRRPAVRPGRPRRRGGRGDARGTHAAGRQGGPHPGHVVERPGRLSRRGEAGRRGGGGRAGHRARPADPRGPHVRGDCAGRAGDRCRHVRRPVCRSRAGTQRPHPAGAGGDLAMAVAAPPGRASRACARDGAGAWRMRAVGMTAERVLRMPFTEMVVRCRQEAWKWVDRTVSAVRPAAGPARVRHPRAGMVLSRFFEGAAHAHATARMLASLPQGRRIIAVADALCRGRFDLLGYRALDFGDPVDWHLDPTSGRRAPFVHWSHLDPLDSALVGDSKVVWELNRHQWLLYLGQAYRFTGDERYADFFGRYVKEWMRANPVGMGINWASSLEVGFRLISWCWALALFEGSPALSGGLRAAMVAGIEDHARHVERYLSYYFSPNTPLTGEALALYYAGVLFPDLPRARQWEALGRRILVAQCERQILPDGVYFEQSTYYQRYTAEIYLHFLILARRNGIGVPESVVDRLQRLLDFLVAVRRPDGSMPLIGDADGGWLLPLTPRAADDLRGVMAVAAAFFARSDYAWAADGPAPDVSWILGAAGQTAFAALTPQPPRTTPSRLFPDGGYAIMQTGWERDAHQLVFDGGPLGIANSGAHGLAGLLRLQCTALGARLLF